MVNVMGYNLCIYNTIYIDCVLIISVIHNIFSCGLALRYENDDIHLAHDDITYRRKPQFMQSHI